MTQKTWVLPLDEEGGISFPEDLIKVMEWEEGTVLAWDLNQDGSIKIKAADHQEHDQDTPEQQGET